MLDSKMYIVYYAVTRMWRTSEGSPERSWLLCVNMNRSKSGWGAVITSCIRHWWRSSSRMYCGLCPVSIYTCTHTYCDLFQGQCCCCTGSRMFECMTDGKYDPAGTLTQAIRNFAKSLEGWLTSAMSDYPQEIVRTKVCVFLKGFNYWDVFSKSDSVLGKQKL